MRPHSKAGHNCNLCSQLPSYGECGYSMVRIVSVQHTFISSIMASTPAQKMKVKEDFSLLTFHAPANFKKVLDAPSGVKMGTDLKSFHQVHWFVTSKAQMEKELKKILSLVTKDVVCWTYYPKVTSGLQTDLTRDKGWDTLLQHQQLHWISLISFDETWSVFGFRLKTAADEKKAAAKPATRPIFDYVDPVKKTVKLPDDLAMAFAKNKKAASFFETISFTGKKEYIDWIITAKQEKTRTERVKGTIERLNKNWKNPRNL